ncbi:reverse transcriptase domain-containing protein [Tanacetum coccineum]
MQTRSSSKFVGEPSTNPTSTIPKRHNRRRSIKRVEPFSLVETPVVTMPDQRTMVELLCAPTEGYAEAIVVPPIPAEHFELKRSLINLVTSKQFFGFEKEDPHAHIRYFNKITSTLKYKDVLETSIKLMLFLFSIDVPARIWLDKEPPHSILTWDDLIAALVDAVKAMVAQKSSPSTFVKAVEEICVTCGGPHPYHQCLATDGNGNTNTVLRASLTKYETIGFAQPNVQNNQTRYNQGYNQNRGNNQGNPSYQAPIQQTQVAPSNELSNYKKIIDTNIKAMQNQINNVKNELRNEMQTSIQTSMSNQTNELKNMMASFFQMNTASSSGTGSLPSNTVANPRGDLKAITTRSGISYDGPPIPPPSSSLPKVVEREPEVTKDTVQPSTENIQPLLREKDDKLALKFVKIFRELHFELSFADALRIIQNLHQCLESLLNNQEKLECLALADLGASINLMPLSIWKKISLPKLTPTQMILELADRSTTSPSGIAEDVFELTLRVDDEAITFKVGQTSRYSYNDVVSINRIDVIDVACEESAQEVFRFSNSSTSGNPTPSLDPILSTFSPSLTPFEEGDFILEEIEACLTNDSIPPGIDDDDFDPEGDLLLLEKLLNDDPSSPLPPKELHVEELKIVKSSIDDPPELELKDLPSHLEYAFLEGTDKLPVIITKDLKEDEKAHLLTVLKSHKRVIAWKISDIKGIDPQFCTHKILMEDDSKPSIQHQRRVNPKIHEVIKKEVIKLLDAGLILLSRGEYQWLNDATRKDHFSLPFMDQMLERLAGNEYYCSLDGSRDTFKFLLTRKTKRRPPSLALMGHDKETIEVYMDDFSVFGDSFSSSLSHLDKMLKRCEDTNLVQNWEKCHFMVKEGIVLGHKISKSGIEIDKAKVMLAKLPHPTSIKGM